MSFKLCYIIKLWHIIYAHIIQIISYNFYYIIPHLSYLILILIIPQKQYLVFMYFTLILLFYVTLNTFYKLKSLL